MRNAEFEKRTGIKNAKGPRWEEKSVFEGGRQRTFMDRSIRSIPWIYQNSKYEIRNPKNERSIKTVRCQVRRQPTSEGRGNGRLWRVPSDPFPRSRKMRNTKFEKRTGIKNAKGPRWEEKQVFEGGRQRTFMDRSKRSIPSLRSGIRVCFLIFIPGVSFVALTSPRAILLPPLWGSGEGCPPGPVFGRSDRRRILDRYRLRVRRGKQD